MLVKIANDFRVFSVFSVVFFTVFSVFSMYWCFLQDYSCNAYKSSGKVSIKKNIKSHGIFHTGGERGDPISITFSGKLKKISEKIAKMKNACKNSQ